VFPLPARKPTPPPAIDNAGLEPEGAAVAMAEPEPAMHGPEPVSLPPRPSELVGLDQPAATRLFGHAAEVSEVPPATVWRYRNANCELDLLFYFDLRSGKMRALHYTFKGEAADPAGQQDCLRSLSVTHGG
jgi:hypothetical protein